MNFARRPFQVFALGLVSLALLGCGSDDPLEFAVTVQDDTTASSVPSEADADTTDGTEDAVFPPVNPDVARPSTIVDLRGQDTVEIEIRDNVFDERFFRVDPGTQIVFVNRGANTHDVTAAAEGAFPKITKEALAEGPQALILSAEGDYPFYCSIHGTQTRGQTGYVVVGGA
jgi:plastocyanin